MRKKGDRKKATARSMASLGDGPEFAIEPEVLPMPEPKAPLAVPTALPMAPMDRMLELENRLAERSAEIVEGVMAFADLPYDSEEPPQQWIDAMGYDAAQRTFRCVKAGQSPSSSVPHGVKVAAQVLAGVMKARALRGQSQTLNVQVVQLTQGTAREYPSIPVDEAE